MIDRQGRYRLGTHYPYIYIPIYTPIYTHIYIPSNSQYSMSFGVRRVSKQIARTSARSEEVLSDEAWMDYNVDIAEYHVVNDPLVLSSSSDDDEQWEYEHEQEDPIRRIDRWMSSHTVAVRMQTPDIVSVEDEEDYDDDYSEGGSRVCLVVPYLSEKFVCLTEYQLELVRKLVVEMLPLLPRSSVGGPGGSNSGSSSSTGISSGGGRAATRKNNKYRLPSVLI